MSEPVKGEGRTQAIKWSLDHETPLSISVTPMSQQPNEQGLWGQWTVFTYPPKLLNPPMMVCKDQSGLFALVTTLKSYRLEHS